MMLVYSQSKGVSIETDSVIAAANGEMRSLMARVENGTNKAQDLRLIVQAGDGVRLLNSDAVVKLEPGETQFIPLKIFIEKSLPAGSSIISLQLRDSSAHVVAHWGTTLTIAPKRQLRLSAEVPQVLIYRAGDSLNISARVFNGGNQTEEADIFASFPQYAGSEITLRKKVILAPFTSQKVEFSRIVDRDLLRMEIFTVNVAGTNANKEFFGNATVTVQNALGNRRFIDPLQNNVYRGSNANRIAWSTSNPFEEFSASHNVDLRSEINVGNTKATVNLNGTYWPNLDTPVMFQNTWLKIENKSLGMQLGNLNGSDMEITLNGRGAQFFYTPQNEKGTAITAGAVEKSYNIFDPFQLSYFPRGYSAFAKTVHQITAREKLDGEVIWDTDPFQKSFIVKGGYSFSNQKNTVYDIDLAYGQTRAVSNPDVMEPSLAAGFNFRKNWDKFTFSSANYYSTGYYPGIRRGSAVSEQRVSRSYDKFSVYGAYGFNRYNPQNIEPLFRFNSYSERHRAELGANFTVAKRFNVNVISQISTEESDVFLGDNFTRSLVSFNSASLTATLNYNTEDQKNRFTLTHAQGLSLYRNISEPQHIYSYQASWQHRNLTLSGNYQYGNFLLYEGNRNGALNTDSEKFSAVTSYRLTLLNSKLNLNLSAFANVDSQNGESFALSSNLDYQMLRTTRLFGSYSYNKFSRSGFGSANSYYQLGISQDLPTIGDETVKYKNGTIRIFTFFDHNNTGTYEPGTDEPANGVKVKINNILFISGDDGYIKYRKLPYGEYAIKSNENEWYSENQKIDLKQKEEFIALPLVKTGVLKGRIRYEKTSKFQYEVQEHVAGIPVIFRTAAGKTFTFYTNALGEYNAYLPVGQYHVSLENQAFQKNVYTESSFDEIKVEAATTTNLEDFILKVREKKVEIKRFGSSD